MDSQTNTADAAAQDGLTVQTPQFFPDIPFVSIQGQIEGRQVKPDPSIVFAILSVISVMLISFFSEEYAAPSAST